MANINDLGRLIANAVKAGLQEVGGAGSSGGVSTTGSNSVMARPTFTNLSAGLNGPTPPYGAQNVINPPFANGGSAGGRPSFGGMAAAGFGGIASQLPSVQQANFVNYANTQLAGRFAPGSQGQGGQFTGAPMPGTGITGQYNAASQFVRQIAQNSTINNPMDVYAGIQKLSYRQNFGIMGDASADPFLKGAGAMSNIVPGAGYEATSQSLFNAFTDPTRQNRMRMMGMSTTDSKTGRPKDPRAIVDMIWNRLNAQKMGSDPITKEDVQRSLMPGRSIDSMLNQLIGDDPLARSAVAKMLIAKAMSGGKSAFELTTKENLIDMGFTTEGMVSASAKSAGEMNKVQSVARAETYGLSKANEAANILAESFAKLNNQLGFANIPGVLAGLIPGKAEGGAVGASNAYMVGEMGPELFVPTSSGYVVPNEKIRLAGARHAGGAVHPHPHPDVSKSDYNSEGQLSPDKIREILSYAGFKGESLGNASKIIGKESARRPGALNPDAGTGDLSYGLFQINMLGNLGPDRRKKFGLSSNDALYDPIINARVGYEMSNKGTSWNAWSTAKDLGLHSGGGGKPGSGSNMGPTEDSGGFLNSMKGLFPSLASGLSGIANKVGSVINYGGVKVEIVLPKGSNVTGRGLVKEMQKALDESNIQSKVTTN
jgi:hypothetical protein